MQNVKLRLDEWRDAERRRDGHARGTPEWQQANGEVRIAETAFHAEVAQMSVRYAEAEYQDGNHWSTPPELRTPGFGIRWRLPRSRAREVTSEP